MFCDLHLPFPQPPPPKKQPNKKNNKGKGKASTPLPLDAASLETTPVVKSCWDGLGGRERQDVANGIGMAGQLGYTIVAYTTTPSIPGQIPPSPFITGRPFPSLDPRDQPGSSSSSSSSLSTSLAGRNNESKNATAGKKIIQLSRLHIMLDDSQTHGLTSANSFPLSTYDLLSLTPLTPQAFQNTCINLTQPGPNQISIITLPLHQNPKMGFYLKRSLVKNALRNGAVFEIPYSPALFPSSSSSSSSTRKTHQNFLTNARELIRVVMAVNGGGGRDGSGRNGKGGGGIIFGTGGSGGTGGGAGGQDREGGWRGMKGPADLVNLAVILGMPANQAAAALSDTPRSVILKAQARKTYKGVMMNPRMIIPSTTVPDPEQTATGAETNKVDNQAQHQDQDIEMQSKNEPRSKRSADDGGGEQTRKKMKV